MSKPIFYFARMVPAYRIPVLEHLNDRLDGRLLVCSGQPPHASSLASLGLSGSGRFRHFRLRNYWFNGEMLHAQPFRHVFREHGTPALVLAEESPRSVTLPFLLRYARIHGARRILWGHFSSNNRSFSPGNFQDRYRLKLAQRVEACVCYSEGIRTLLSRYLPSEKLFVARNTLDMQPLFDLHDQLQQEGKPAVRQRLDLPIDAPVLVFIGRLVPEKGTDLLLDTFVALRRSLSAWLLIIGDGPERAPMEYRIRQEAISNVRFLGSMTEAETSAPYLYAADLMLMPSYLGLSVNHAFAFGVPVVSRQAPAAIRYHGPEVEYVIHGNNGMLCSWDDPDDLLAGIRYVLDRQAYFSENARAYARAHLTMDRMVEGLVDAIHFVCDSV